MPQLYAFQPNGHGPSSFFVIAESIEDAVVRVKEYARKNEMYSGSWHGIDRPYSRAGIFGYTWTNANFNLTILNPGEVIDNDNS